MLVTQFPNINWLKRQIRHQFQDQQGPNGRTLPFVGWPTVLLNTKTQHTVREDIQGPFSLFMNVRGTSTIGANGHQVKIRENAYVITNNEEHYDLLIDDSSTTETFNIHFGTQFLEDAWHYLNHKDDALLDMPYSSQEELPQFSLKATWRNPRLNQLTTLLAQSYSKYKTPSEEKENLFLAIFETILFQQQEQSSQLQQLQSSKKSTKQELAKRLHLAVDYIYAYYDEAIHLEELAQLSCLSKYHFLRSFKQAFGRAPYQFIKEIRCKKAIQLLQNSTLSIQEIATMVGIENASSLSRMLFKNTGKYPSSFR